MSPQQAWRELYRGDDLDHVSMVATCLNAMEFETRLLDAQGKLIEERTERRPESSFAIHVPSREWGSLTEVLGEIIDEQRQFDAMLDECRDQAGRRDRQWLVVLTAIVIVLAIFGLIEL